MDFITDLSGRHLLNINKVAQVPDFVKCASVDAESISAIPDHLFADTARREFPLDDAGHVYLSQAYCHSAGIKDANIIDRIKKAARLFPEVEAELPKLEAAFSEFEKSASVEQPLFAVYVDFGAEDGVKKASGIRGFYDISNPDNVEAAAYRLGEDKHRLPIEVFSGGCREVCKAASQYGILSRLSPTVKSYGIERLPDFEFVKQQAAQRVELTKNAAYRDIADSAEADPSAGDWAELWAGLDREHQIKYSKHTLDPYRVFNSGILKSAMDRELSQWTLLCDTAVPVAALQAIKGNRIEQTFTKAAADKIKLLLQTKKTANDDLTKGLVSLDLPVQKALLKLALA